MFYSIGHAYIPCVYKCVRKERGKRKRKRKRKEERDRERKEKEIHLTVALVPSAQPVRSL